jgi:hypothetical protein
MRNRVPTVVTFLIVGTAAIAGAAIAAITTFFAMFYCLRVVCWIAKNDDYMLYMWAGLFIEPVAALTGLALGGLAGFHLVNRVNRQTTRGFDILPLDSAHTMPAPTEHTSKSD